MRNPGLHVNIGPATHPHSCAALILMVLLKSTPKPAMPAADDIRRMFDRISPTYDLCNSLLSLGMDQRLRKLAVGLARPPEDGRLLDVCTGTADLALAARRMHPRAQVVGVDFAGQMLSKAQPKVAEKKIGLVQANCLRLPLLDATFDAIAIAWGLRNLADLNAGLLEMARVLRKGGRLVVLEFSEPRSALPARVLGAAFGLHSRLVGLIAPRGSKAYTYLPESIDRFPSADELSSLIGECGFEVESVNRRVLGCICVHVAVKL
ncbi:MAG: ubiquinone/menaquinone biosynthesis methyltransferase [Planctomycetes bacterium]|nr:ubiquinone/menaquinone biosynthesis methyltransferase [Planctomycetota bacterium]